jgi:autotransporter adhesin
MAQLFSNHHRVVSETTQRHRIAFWASSAFAAGALALSAAPVLAGCNSGDQANTLLLGSAGCRAAAAGNDAVAIGPNAAAVGNLAIALGRSAGDLLLDSVGTTSIGAFSRATGVWSTAIGGGLFLAPFNEFLSARAKGDYSIAIGGGDDSNRGARADSLLSVAIGSGSLARGEGTTAVGGFAAYGAKSDNSGYNSAFGYYSGWLAAGSENTAIGLSSGYQVTGHRNAGIGTAAGQYVTGSNNTASGFLAGSVVNGSFNVAVGDNAGRDINASDTVAVGTNARATANQAVAIGRGASVTVARSVAIGQGSLANVVNTVSVGNTSLKRRIVNVAPGTQANDAVNLAQLQAAVAAATPAVIPTSVTDHSNYLMEDVRREMTSLRALVKQQQQRITDLESRMMVSGASLEQ